MAPELRPGMYIVCQACPARIGSTPLDYSCDTSKLNGITKKQPVQCPKPRVDYKIPAERIDPYKMLRNQLNK